MKTIILEWEEWTNSCTERILRNREHIFPYMTHALVEPLANKSISINNIIPSCDVSLPYSGWVLFDLVMFRIYIDIIDIWGLCGGTKIPKEYILKLFGVMWRYSPYTLGSWYVAVALFHVHWYDDMYEQSECFDLW